MRGRAGNQAVQAASSSILRGWEKVKTTDLSTGRSYFIIALAFLCIKLFTWGVGYGFASTDGWQLDLGRWYQNYHLEPDTRMTDGKADFFRLWNYNDSEWYLSIARFGYPSGAQMIADRSAGNSFGFYSVASNSGFRYVFLPLYPWIIRFFAAALGIWPGAFISTFFISALSVFAFIYFARQYFPGENSGVLWTFLLLFLFPFSIFFSLYYTEPLFFLLSLLVFAFLKGRRYLPMAIAGFLLALTRPNGFFIIVPVLLGLYLNREKRLWPYALSLLIPMGYFSYMAFGYFKTGDWNLFNQAFTAWHYHSTDIAGNLARHLHSAMHFFSIPFHDYRDSKVELISALFFGIVIVLMWLDRKFPRELAAWSTLMWAMPIAVKDDFASFSRYMSTLFPLFFFIGLKAGRLRYLLLAIFAVGYYFALRAVIRYDWVG